MVQALALRWWHWRRDAGSSKRLPHHCLLHRTGTASCDAVRARSGSICLQLPLAPSCVSQSPSAAQQSSNFTLVACVPVLQQTTSRSSLPHTQASSNQLRHLSAARTREQPEGRYKYRSGQGSIESTTYEDQLWKKLKTNSSFNTTRFLYEYPVRESLK